MSVSVMIHPNYGSRAMPTCHVLWAKPVNGGMAVVTYDEANIGFKDPAHIDRFIAVLTEARERLAEVLRSIAIEAEPV